MQSEFTADWGYHLPLIEKLLKDVSAIENLVVCAPLQKAVLTSLKERFSDYKSNRNAVATVLHPAFKRKYVAQNIEGIDLDVIIDKIIIELDMLDRQTPLESSPALAPMPLHLSFFYGQTFTTPDDNKSLLEKYFLEDDKSLDLLLQPKYAKLKQIFIKYNTQLLSSAASERLFSLAKYILTFSRVSLSEDVFEKSVILHASRRNTSDK